MLKLSRFNSQMFKIYVKSIFASKNWIFCKKCCFSKSEFWDWPWWIELLRTSFSAEMSTLFGGAKEAQNFKLKVHSGPEGSRGLDYHRNEVFCHKFHLEYLSTSSPELVYTKFLFKVTKELLNRNESESWRKIFSKIEFPIWTKIKFKMNIRKWFLSIQSNIWHMSWLKSRQ